MIFYTLIQRNFWVIPIITIGYFMQAISWKIILFSTFSWNLKTLDKKEEKPKEHYMWNKKLFLELFKGFLLVKYEQLVATSCVTIN